MLHAIASHTELLPLVTAAVKPKTLFRMLNTHSSDAAVAIAALRMLTRLASTSAALRKADVNAACARVLDQHGDDADVLSLAVELSRFAGNKDMLAKAVAMLKPAIDSLDVSLGSGKRLETLILRTNNMCQLDPSVSGKVLQTFYNSLLRTSLPVPRTSAIPVYICN